MVWSARAKARALAILGNIYQNVPFGTFLFDSYCICAEIRLYCNWINVP